MDKFNVGDKVTYQGFSRNEKGIVKALSTNDCCFVVYACGCNWDKYSDYTGARTHNRDLVKGWPDEA
jgi:hypothetical protein